jgi:hypothetical protein
MGPKPSRVVMPVFRRREPAFGPAERRSVPLALASLVLGSRRSETGLCEIGSGELPSVRRGHEAHFARDAGRSGQLSLLI